MFLRHAETDYSQIDTGRLDDRAGQRNLSEAGRAQARELGAAFEALDIEFAHVRTSPVYRARDTAELAFGPDAIEVTMDLVADDYAGGNLRDMIAATRGLLAPSRPREKTCSSSATARLWRWSPAMGSRTQSCPRARWPSSRRGAGLRACSARCRRTR